MDKNKLIIGGSVLTGCGLFATAYRYNLLNDKSTYFLGGSAMTVLGISLFNWGKPFIYPENK
tara:strand:+ start:30 stop:215 length:186 start_codon:yes stop_codon:yes gene_type:complete